MKLFKTAFARMRALLGLASTTVTATNHFHDAPPAGSADPTGGTAKGRGRGRITQGAFGCAVERGTVTCEAYTAHHTKQDRRGLFSLRIRHEMKVGAHIYRNARAKPVEATQ